MLPLSSVQQPPNNRAAMTIQTNPPSSACPSGALDISLPGQTSSALSVCFNSRSSSSPPFEHSNLAGQSLFLGNNIAAVRRAELASNPFLFNTGLTTTSPFLLNTTRLATTNPLLLNTALTTTPVLARERAALLRAETTSPFLFNTGLTTPFLNTGLTTPFLNTGLTTPFLNTGLTTPFLNTGLTTPFLNTGLTTPFLNTALTTNPVLRERALLRAETTSPLLNTTGLTTPFLNTALTTNPVLARERALLRAETTNPFLFNTTGLATTANPFLFNTTGLTTTSPVVAAEQAAILRAENPLFLRTNATLAAQQGALFRRQRSFPGSFLGTNTLGNEQLAAMTCQREFPLQPQAAATCFCQATGSGDLGCVACAELFFRNTGINSVPNLAALQNCIFR